MTNDELIALIAANAQAIARLEVNSATQAQGLARLETTVESQGRNTNEALATLLASAEIQARSIESMREGMSHNTEVMANALEISAISQRTAAAATESAAAAFELSANTSRNLDRLERDIAEMKVMLGIIIKDNQADRARISGLEDED